MTQLFISHLPQSAPSGWIHRGRELEQLEPSIDWWSCNHWTEWHWTMERDHFLKKQHNGKNTVLWQHGERDEREMWPTLRHEAACLFLLPRITSRCLWHALLPEGLLQATENLGFANQYIFRKRWMNYLNQWWYKLQAPERINSNTIFPGWLHKLVYDHKNVMRRTCQTGPPAFYHFSNSES